MKTCSTCRYWARGDTVGGVFAICERIPHSGDVLVWNDEDSKFDIDPYYADRTALACDGSGWSAQVVTKPEHFCSMWAGEESEE